MTGTQILREAAELLHRYGRHEAAEECGTVAALIAVDIAFGDAPGPAPGNRLTRITEAS